MVWALSSICQPPPGLALDGQIGDHRDHRAAIEGKAGSRIEAAKFADHPPRGVPHRRRSAASDRPGRRSPEGRDFRSDFSWPRRAGHDRGAAKARHSARLRAKTPGGSNLLKTRQQEGDPGRVMAEPLGQAIGLACQITGIVHRLNQRPPRWRDRWDRQNRRPAAAEDVPADWGRLRRRR